MHELNNKIIYVSYLASHQIGTIDLTITFLLRTVEQKGKQFWKLNERTIFLYKILRGCTEY